MKTCRSTFGLVMSLLNYWSEILQLIFIDTEFNFNMLYLLFHPINVFLLLFESHAIAWKKLASYSTWITMILLEFHMRISHWNSIIKCSTIILLNIIVKSLFDYIHIYFSQFHIMIYIPRINANTTTDKWYRCNCYI